MPDVPAARPPKALGLLFSSPRFRSEKNGKENELESLETGE